MFNTQELATLLAALQFWKEEIVTNGNEVARPYLDHVGMVGIEPLTMQEVKRLSRRLRALHQQ